VGGKMKFHYVRKTGGQISLSQMAEQYSAFRR